MVWGTVQVKFVRQKLSLSLILIFCIPLLGAAPSAPQAWPGFRGAGDCHTTAQRLPTEWADQRNVAWRADLPGYGQSSPVVWGNRIFLTSVEGVNKEKLLVSAYDLKKGDRLWLNQYDSTMPMKDANTVSKAAPTPVVDGRRLYVFFESGDLMALDHGGKLLWQRRLTKEYGEFKAGHGLGSSLAMTDRALILLAAHLGPSYLLAIDKQTGRNLWKTDRQAAMSWATPLITEYKGQSQIIITASGEIAAYETRTGAQLWSVKGLKGNVIPSPSLSGDLVVIGSSDKGSNVAIRLGGVGDVTGTHVLWRAQEATANFASPLIRRGRVYLVNKVGVAFCLDLQTGAEIWRERVGGECWATPLAAGDRVYFFTNEGVTTVMRDGAKPELIARNVLSEVERIYGIAAVDGALLLRSGRKLIKLSEQ
jgi:outer membrane protein assembly factor BamB